MSGTANPGWSKAKYAARDSHLDQDAAGRLLEGTRDRARREMTVPIVLLSDRTRLIDLLPLLWQTTALSELDSGRAVVRPAAWSRLIQACGFIFVSFATACASAPVTASTPTPVDERALPSRISSKARWLFIPDPTPKAYRSSATTLLTLASRTDTTRLSSQYTLSFHRQAAAVSASGFLSFLDIQTTAPGNQAGRILESIQFTGRAPGTSVILDSAANNPANTPTCESPAAGVIAMLIHRHSIVLPLSLDLGATWRDTTSVNACYGSIPMSYRISRDYTVLGETSLNGTSLLLVSRLDSLDGSGEGASGQHRVIVGLRGSSSANLYLNPEHGTLVNAELEQRSNISVTTSGRTQLFNQIVRESVQLSGSTN